ncbi:protein angel homolog 1 [Scleropages formosus]|uniref:Angel homolog 1 n=1 Tax=Scleropages formosus TaxID=113540 RepID=A0A8C9SK42_SCLFO|nr:protein angel homolog 1 [Scleropages formosus]XP_029114565.1 protein angel homolog 1 [Scleropages formosus]XP_029114566.1 protein angel homolog 1 [Scleropages formosus]
MNHGSEGPPRGRVPGEGPQDAPAAGARPRLPGGVALDVLAAEEQRQGFDSGERVGDGGCPSAGDSDMELETEDEGWGDNRAEDEEELWEGRAAKGKVADGVCPRRGTEERGAVTALLGAQSDRGLGTALHLGAAACVDWDSSDWHFSSEPGLDHLVHCPPWQFPYMSYYALPQQVVPFGGTEPCGTALLNRVWEDVPESREQAAPGDPFTFTVMSYNILAQELLEANAQLYHHCEPHVLHWEFRLQNILRDFDEWRPDIMCLQEVQENHFTDHLQPALSKLGYSCVYKQRTGAKTDGCAICYRRSSFSQVSVRLVEFFRPQIEVLNRHNVGVVLLLQPVGPSGSEAMAQGPPLCVATTHLLFNPRRGDVKLAQLAVLLAEIDDAVKPWKSKGMHCPIVLCGDFNAVPNMPLYQLITTGQLYYHGMPAWMISGQEDLSYRAHHQMLFAPLLPGDLGITRSCQYVAGHKGATQSKESGGVEHGSRSAGRLQYSHEFLEQFRFCEAARVRPQDLETIPGVTDATPDQGQWKPNVHRFSNTLCHELNLRSAYSHYMSGTGHPEVTTMHSDFGTTVDYIFYSSGPGRHMDHRGGKLKQDVCLKLTGRLSLLSEENLWLTKGLPNDVLSSDHLFLLARFQLGHSSV